MYFEQYKSVLDVFQNARLESELKGDDKAKNAGFRVHDQGIMTFEQKKLGLSADYHKRYVLTGGIHTKPLEFWLLTFGDLACPSDLLNFYVEWKNKEHGITVYLTAMKITIKITGKVLHHNHPKTQLM